MADLVNDHKFAEVSLAKILCSILNNIINIQIRQSLSCQMCFCSEFAKVSLYMVHLKFQHMYNIAIYEYVYMHIKGTMAGIYHVAGIYHDISHCHGYNRNISVSAAMATIQLFVGYIS